MSTPVKIMEFSDGCRLHWNFDDANAKAVAVRLNLLQAIREKLGKVDCERGAAGIRRDGDRFVAVLAWDGFENPSVNRWITVSATPPGEAAVDLLLFLIRQMIGEDKNPRILEDEASWRN